MGISLTLNSRQPVRGRSGIARTSTSRRLGVVVNRARSGCQAICWCSCWRVGLDSFRAFNVDGAFRMCQRGVQTEHSCAWRHLAFRLQVDPVQIRITLLRLQRMVEMPAGRPAGCWLTGMLVVGKPTGNSCAPTRRCSFVSIAVRSGGSGGWSRLTAVSGPEMGGGQSPRAHTRIRCGARRHFGDQPVQFHPQPPLSRWQNTCVCGSGTRFRHHASACRAPPRGFRQPVCLPESVRGKRRW